MTYNPKIHHRRSIRLKDYDYSQSGIYFITICVDNKECLFGQIDDVFDDNGRNIDSKFTPTDIGKIAQEEWFKTAEIRKNIELDAFVLMPNHLHGIIIINNDYDNGGAGTDKNNSCGCRGTGHRAPTIEQFGKPTANTIPTIMRGYKATVTKQGNILRNTPSAPVWQKNYYEHIIRNEKSLEKIRNYIFNNVYGWKKDKLYMGMGHSRIK